jgi:hypothetical protein
MKWTGRFFSRWLFVGVMCIVLATPSPACALPDAQGGRDSHVVSRSACDSTGNHDRHVALWGDDAGDGRLAHPWRTAQHAADQATAGDTVWMHAGVYREWVAFGVSGTAEQPISFRACPGETVVFDGHGLDWRYGLDIGESDHLRFEGFLVRDYIREGLRGNGFDCGGGCRDIQLRDMEFMQVGTAVKFGGDDADVLLEDIYAHDYDFAGFDCGPAGPCNHFTLRRFIALGPGTGNDTAVDGFAVESGSDILVEDSVSVGHPGDGFDFKSDRTVLRRVISRDQARNGIKLWGSESRLENGLSAGNGLEALVLAGGGSYEVVNSLLANTRWYGYLASILDGRARPWGGGVDIGPYEYWPASRRGILPLVLRGSN